MSTSQHQLDYTISAFKDTIPTCAKCQHKTYSKGFRVAEKARYERFLKSLTKIVKVDLAWLIGLREIARVKNVSSVKWGALGKPKKVQFR